MVAARQHIEFLGNSSSPVRLMSDLDRREQPARQDELVTQSLSRATVHRVTDKLADRNWITKAGGQHALTVAGALVLQRYTKFIDVSDRDAFEFLSDSPIRAKLLKFLRSWNQPAAPAELTEQVSETSTTVWRCLDSLKEHRWVHQPEKPRYTLTETGTRIIGAFERLAASIEWITEHVTILNHLDSVGDDLPVVALAGGDTTVIQTSQADREAVLNHYGDYLVDPSPFRIRGTSPIASTLLNDMHRPLLDEGIEINLIIDESVMEVARSSYPEALRGADQAETLRLYLSPNRLKLGLTVLDFEEHARMFLFAYDNQGNLRACIDSTADNMVGWATALYEDYRNTAQSLSTTDLSAFP